MDYSKYHPQWKARLRIQVLLDQNFKCRLCGYKDMSRLGRNRKRIALQVHHVDFNKSNNEPSNLMALCPACHKAVHNKVKLWTDDL